MEGNALHMCMVTGEVLVEILMYPSGGNVHDIEECTLCSGHANDSNDRSWPFVARNTMSYAASCLDC